METLFSHILNSSHNGIYRYRFDTGEILVANQGLVDLLDLTCQPSELEGRRLNELMIYTEHEGQIRAHLKATGVLHDFEYHFKTLKGADRWVLHDSFLARDPDTGEQFVDSIVKDITERIHVERELAAERERLAVTLHSIGDAVISTDVDSRVLLMNAVAETLTGWTQAEACGHLLDDVFKIVNEQTGKPAVNPLQQVLATGTVVGLANHTVLIARNGRSRNIADSAAPIRQAGGTIIGVVLVFRDVTEAYELQRALLTSETKYRMLFSRLCEAFALHEMLFDADGKPCDYRFLEINQAFEQMTGLNASEVVGRRATEVLPGLEPFWIEMYGRVVTTGEPVSFEHAAQTLNRVYRVTAFRPQEGRFATLFLDITEQRKTEEERRRLEQQMQQTQRLESLGMLAGGIAHDFNNLLTGVLGNADLALCELPNSTPVHSYLTNIEVAARRAADLCRQMLAYAGRGAIEKHNVNLNRIIDETTHLLEVTVSKKAVMKFQLADNLPSILVDPSQIGQVLMNLVLNASEAIGEKSGVIVISTGAMDCDRHYLHTTYMNDRLPPGPYVYLEVSDTGCGMDDATRQHIFDPFFTTKFTGRGLGLAAVLGIVRSSKGAIRVYSEPRKGTTFKLLFPAAETLPDAQSHDATQSAAWRGEGTVLLVDDEDTVRLVGKAMLERMGFRVLTANDGRQALDIFKSHAREITVVVLDLTMPHMNGEETYRELRQMGVMVPIIISSGYNEKEIAERFAGKGATDYIQKPYTLAHLREVMQRHVRAPATGETGR